MFLSYITLAVALSLSVIAAYYSIAGLTAIFAAAVIPIVIMGGILEVGKVVVTLWLHEYWQQCRLLMKMYLVPAVAVLMLITSMGIFGFLSKAHSDQSMVSGDVQAKIAVYDEKIKVSQDNIDVNRKALKQLDEAVDQSMARSTTETGADKAVAIRKSQAKERSRLLAEIAAEQKTISALRQERAPISAEVRKVEAEVGPIKYIAKLIYGDNPDANLLEKAVTWVIIVIVAVFDPLAIMMLLAATESLKWGREKRLAPQPTESNSEPEVEEQPPAEPEPEKSILEQHPYLTQGFAHFTDLQPIVHKPEPKIDPVPVEVAQSVEDEEERPEVQDAIRRWKAENPNDTLKNQRARLARGEIDELPWMQLIQVLPAATNSGYGNQFPGNANKGDIFVRIDKLPNLVYKYNGNNWIEIDKNLTDSYTYDVAYIDHLIDRISCGEYDTELLSESEKEQVKQRLENRA
jgi:hypothetical protein